MIQVRIAIEIARIADFNSFHSTTTMSLDHVTKKVSPRISTKTHKGTFSTSLAFYIRGEMNHLFQIAFLFLKNNIRTIPGWSFFTFILPI